MALALPIVNTVLNGITFVSTLALRNENSVLNASIKGSLRTITRELEILKTILEDDKYEDLQAPELLYDIEDFIERLWIPGKTAGFFLTKVGKDPRQKDIATINGYKEEIKIVKEKLEGKSKLRKEISESTQSQSGASSSARPPTTEKDLVGVSETKNEILNLLVAPTHGEQVRATNDMRLRVIFIVGCRGLGKTALARAVYDDHTAAAVCAFHCKAWVAVPKYETKNHPSTTVEAILKKILQQVRSPFNEKKDSSASSSSNTISQEDEPMATNGQSTDEALRSFLMKKRYLVCIDGVQHKDVWDEIKEVWDKIEDGLPENDMGSRILVTTNVDSVAKACSFGSYVYKMQCLDRPNSEKLLWLKALKPKNEPSEAVAQGSGSIFDKCDGLPLALISAGNYLKGVEQTKLKPACERVGKEIGDFLAGEEATFAEIKRVLVQCYGNLPDYSHKNCLVYASILPRDYQINIRSLARKLIAEGLLEKDIYRGIPEEVDHARKCLEELINQSMIEKVLADNDSKIVERCKVQSIILEFFMTMALSKNFVTLFDKHKTTQSRHGHTRRLITGQLTTKATSCDLPKRIKMSTVRSLTMFNYNFLQGAPESLSANRTAPKYFKSCNVLRVLDLQGCTGLDNRVLKAICGLVLLKYLSLRKTDVNELPGRLKKLRLLQTLDIRETRVLKLPKEVIMLPVLAYLFGEFELPQLTYKDKDFKKFLNTESRLHTLAGILVDGADLINSFELVIEHAKMLRKVMIWCKNTSALSSEVHPRLARALERRPVEMGLESLSIDFNDVPNAFLDSLEKPTSTISSIKVRRGSGTLPRPDELQKVRNLNKLHLFSTGRSIEELAALQSLHCLEYLKLADDRDESWNGNFHVESDGFNSLHWLCFEASKYPRISIEGGGMEHLASLVLLCPNPPDPEEAPGIVVGVKGVSFLTNLNEVVLHRSAPDTIVEAWKKAANLHMNKPYVKKQHISTPSGAVELEASTN